MKTIVCTCGRKVQIRTDQRIPKHASGERRRRNLLIQDRCAMSGRKIKVIQAFISGGSSVIWWGVAP